MNFQKPRKLFSPYKLGPLVLEHRVVMPPLTRLRADEHDSPSAMMVTHYEQRASKGGLIIIEAASVSNKGPCSMNVGSTSVSRAPALQASF